MKSILNNVLLGILGVILVGHLQGCVPLLVGAAAGAGGVAYVQGILEKNVDAPVSKVYKASLSALRQMGYIIISDELDKHSAHIKSQFEDEKKINIDVSALTEKSSKIQVRVGVFGDETKSQMILNAILKKL